MLCLALKYCMLDNQRQNAVLSPHNARWEKHRAQQHASLHGEPKAELPNRAGLKYKQPVLGTMTQTSQGASEKTKHSTNSLFLVLHNTFRGNRVMPGGRQRPG